MLLGIVGMVVAWIVAVGNCLCHHWNRNRSVRRTSQLERCSLQCSIVLYGSRDFSWLRVDSGYVGATVELGSTGDVRLVDGCSRRSLALNSKLCCEHST